MLLNLNWMKKKVRFEFYEWKIKISLQLISIFLCDNNNRTISILPSDTAWINGVQFKFLSFNFINDCKFKCHKRKKVRLKYHECFWIKTSLQLTSISSYDNNNRTISNLPLYAAKINGVLLNVRIQFHKW